ncbi:MAG: YkgJ family cysteine cluster protein [bacterium]
MIASWPALSNPHKDKPETWVKYKKGMCALCNAICCTMPIEMYFEDIVRLGWAFEDEEPRKVAKRLLKENKISRYRDKAGVFLMMRGSDHACIMLTKERKCCVYNKRPLTCQNFPQKSSRSGYCPAVRK